MFLSSFFLLDQSLIMPLLVIFFLFFDLFLDDFILAALKMLGKRELLFLCQLIMFDAQLQFSNIRPQFFIFFLLGRKLPLRILELLHDCLQILIISISLITDSSGLIPQLCNFFFEMLAFPFPHLPTIIDAFPHIILIPLPFLL